MVLVYQTFRLILNFGNDGQVNCKLHAGPRNMFLYILFAQQLTRTRGRGSYHTIAELGVQLDSEYGHQPHPAG
jgi:hypothetical protein